MGRNDNIRTIRTLVGAKHFSLSLRCLKTLQRFNAEPFNLAVHEDGTLSSRELAQLEAFLAPVSIIRYKDATEAMRLRLAPFPACDHFRRNHPLAMKLLDIPLHEEGDILMVDSDVCFFRPFEGLFKFPDAKTGAVFMKDFQNGYSLRPVDFFPIGPFRMPCKANTGLLHFRRECYDLEYLEWVLSRYGAALRQRMEWWVEQTCWAALGGRTGCRMLNENQFCVAREGDGNLTTRIGVHFVGASRHLFEGAYGHVGQNVETQLAPEVVSTTAVDWANGVKLCTRFGLMVVRNKMNKALHRMRI